MADSQRLTHADDETRRGAQIDALVDAGLDRYFAGRFEDAIHLWTRVLFLDRTHQRARAYIDRARTGLAERQRRSDELLHTSRELLEQGQADAARRVLAEAMAVQADEAQATALRARLDRLERAGALQPLTLPSVTPATVPGWSWRDTRAGTWRWLLAFGAASAVGILATALFVGSGTGTLPAEGAPPAAAVPPPVLNRSEVAIVRARALFGQGRLAEALVALDRVVADGPERAAADALRIEIQQLLLASVWTAPTAPSREIQR
jgi:tetratricopeptide (TPR) repeat protein